jgi:RAB6A-GEF complex partner protein 1
MSYVSLHTQAFEFTASYRKLDYFSHSLEVLLHTILEKSEGKNTDLLLGSAIALVKKFPQALQVIVNCARKSEMCLWKSFFDVADDPKVLYQQSLFKGDLATATSYLIIIQTLESAKVSGEVSIWLT